MEIIKALTPVIGIIAATTLGVTALLCGFDGVMLTTLIGSICLLSGYKLPQLKQIVDEIRG